MTERRRTDRRGNTKPFLGVDRREAADRRAGPTPAFAEARHVAENAAALSVLFAQLESRARSAADPAAVRHIVRGAWPEIEERLDRLRG